jgi:hypothetical protein
MSNANSPFACLPACPPLQEASLSSLSAEACDPRAAADSQQGSAVLRDVLAQAFAEADLQGSGLIQPGEQLTQLLFAAAAHLTSVMVGTAPLSREDTGEAAGWALNRTCITAVDLTKPSTYSTSCGLSTHGLEEHAYWLL